MPKPNACSHCRAKDAASSTCPLPLLALGPADPGAPARQQLPLETKDLSQGGQSRSAAPGNNGLGHAHGEA